MNNLINIKEYIKEQINKYENNIWINEWLHASTF